jgi:flagellar motor switch protein FliN/FliY
MDEHQGETAQSLRNVRQTAFTRLPIEIRVIVGRARPTVQDLLALAKNSLLPLDRTVLDPVELYVGDKLIARGQLEELDGDCSGQLAVRLLEVSDDREGH